MLGLEPTLEPGNPWNHKIPVTPIMDTQIDDLVIKGILIPLTVRFLNNLKDKIDEKKRENWLDIYLAIFIMMSNVEWILKDVVEYTDRHGMKVWTQQILNSSGISPPTKLYANSFFLSRAPEEELLSLQVIYIPVKLCFRIFTLPVLDLRLFRFVGQILRPGLRS